jgi:selenocysteine-specific elongation factor
VIVGTAGHIDHGKTTLVEKLTGIRTDRLPEERERGMTLDVGYAEFRLPDGTEVGLLDVPGHERLVRTMVAGATSMDLALLVVAADDGPMLQTREHVDVLDLLGVRRGVVALTKVDLVPKDHADLVEQEIRDLLAGTTLEGAPVLRVSSTTGEGIEELKRALADAVPALDDRGGDPRSFRMPVLRAFVAPGRGTVVTGIPVAGRVVEGDAVEVLPPAWQSRVRGIQVHHRDATEARAGHRAALALADVQADRVERGMVVAAAGTLVPAPRFSARLRAARRLDKPLEHGAAVRVHVGADQVAARLHLLSGGKLAAGEEAAVEIQGQRPFLVAPGDRFVLRTDNSSATLGGGVVVERLDQRLPRRREGLSASILERAERVHDPLALIEGALRAAGERGTDVRDAALATGLREDAVPGFVEALAAQGRAAAAGGRLFDPAARARLAKRVLDATQALHRKEPGLPWLPLSALRAALARFEPRAVEAAIDDLSASGELRRSPEGGVARKGHSSEMPASDRERCDKVLALLERGGASPPDEPEIRAALGVPPAQARRLLGLLDARKEAVRAGPFWFHARWVARAKETLSALAARTGGFTASEAREALGTTRKYVIPFLEALDDMGFTKRTGDVRTVKS